jgi:preprotein translocase subunit SecF
MRGKKLTEVLTADEIRKKTEHEPYGLAPPPEQRPQVVPTYQPQVVPTYQPQQQQQQQQQQVQQQVPPQQEQGFVAKMTSLRSRVAKYVKRAAILAIFIAIVLVVHSLDPVRVRVASLLGTTSGSPLLQSTSTAIPFAVVVAVAVTWFMEVG